MIRIRIGKGLYLNIGKKNISVSSRSSGNSTTVGTRGLSQSSKLPGGFRVGARNGRPRLSWSWRPKK